MTVLLILVSSILTPILLKVLYGKDKNKQGPAAGEGEVEAVEGGGEASSPDGSNISDTPLAEHLGVGEEINQ